jgi:hypothetical protein
MNMLLELVLDYFHGVLAHNLTITLSEIANDKDPVDHLFHEHS